MPLNEDNLRQFYGTENWHRWSQLFPRMLLTDGAKYVAENGGEHGAYWLMDAIASYQPAVLRSHPKARDFQLWTLHVNTDHSAWLTCQEDSDQPPIVEQKIEHTDFDLKEFSLYCMPVGDGEHYTLLLRSEY